MNAPERVSKRGAVVDIGSNTIKILVGEMNGDQLRILFDRTLECRISEGMYSSPPKFTEEAMKKASNGVAELLEFAQELSPERVEILATSAVRDAENREVFRAKIHANTGHRVTVLSGREEAAGIAMGVAQEPLLDPSQPYSITDLGGGSLEWIYCSSGEVEHMVSMDIGAVRLMNRFVKDPDAPLGSEVKTMIKNHCHDIMASSLPERIEPHTNHWGTGGAFTISRLILATENQVSLVEQSPSLPLRELRRIEHELSALPLAQRQHFPGLPKSRADILPVALIVIQALAERLGEADFKHSFYNLRMGRLAKLLGKT